MDLRASHVLPAARATFDPLPRAAIPAEVRYQNPRLLILHSNAGARSATWAQLKAWIERTFAGGTGDRGVAQPHIQFDFSGMTQGLPFNVQGTCSAKANAFSVGGESQDYGAATLQRTPWNPQQIEDMAQTAAHLHLHPEYTFELQLCTAWDGIGIGAHRWFPQWSKYVGKTCPGDARVAQIPRILDRAWEIVRAVSAPGAEFPPFAPEWGAWGLQPLVPHNERPTLVPGSGFGGGPDVPWVKYLQGVLAIKGGKRDVVVHGLLDTPTVHGLREWQAFSEATGTPVGPQRGEVHEADWAWIDRLGAS